MQKSRLENQVAVRDLRLLGIWVATVLAAGTLGYVLIEDLTPFDALYMTVITVSTVGYEEVGELSTLGRVFTLLVITAGVTTFFFAGGFLARAVLANVPRRNERRMEKAIEKLDHHVILCGYGRLGQVVREELEAAGRPFVVIDHREDVVAELLAMRVPCLHGDATDEELLAKAGIDRASGVIATVGTDADNVFITLTARQRNPECRIVARAEDPRSERQLLRVGADRVVPPYQLGGLRLAQAFLRPSALDLADLALGERHHEVIIDEIRLPADLPEDQRTLAAMQLGSRYSLIAVAVHRPDGSRAFNPRADTPLRPGDSLLVLGEPQDIDAYLRLLGNCR
ncbi:MAG: potassium channel protein [Planctomycetes bacterium]|nr:potassium channel protein [Planctomycetota bacterium]MBL7007972.1 potassium channel protein [Planctomycetota bacterium]